MKRKALKITESTLFIYKKEKSNLGRFETEPTTTISTVLTGTTGIFNSNRNFN
jgi:hypothetical protein